MRRKSFKHKALNDKDWLQGKYLDEQLSTRAIAEIVGCSMGTVLNALKRHEIDSRDSAEAKALLPLESKKYPLLNDKQWLRQKYEEEGLGTNRIAGIVGCKTPNSVRQALQRFGIQVRNVSEGLTINREDDGFVLNLPVVEGSLMGDATLGIWNPESDISNPYFSKSNKYEDHIRLVASQIFSGNYEDRLDLDNDYPTVRSLSHPELKPVYERWYPGWNDRVKVIPEDLDLCSTFLLHWFLDDGSSYHRRKRSPTKQIAIEFCTECFTQENQEMLTDKLNDRFGLDFKVKHRNQFGTGYRITLPQSRSQDFFDLIGPPPVSSLAYKWK